MKKNFCKHCNSKLNITLIDFGKMPIANEYGFKKNKKYDLNVMFCRKCFLIQNTNYLNPKKIFNKYYYESKHSIQWIKHCKNLVKELKKYGFKNANILEIGSNDLTLGKLVKLHKGNYTGIDPAKNIFKKNKKLIRKDFQLICDYFSENLAKKLVGSNKFKIIIGTNVIAHIPDINNFVKGLFYLMENETIAIFEFQYFGDMLKHTIFDTIYHEHYYYHSLTSLNIIFRNYGMEIFNFKKIDIHSGSLRIYVRKKKNKVNKKILNFINLEKKNGISHIGKIKSFQNKSQKYKYRFNKLFKEKLKNKLVCAYGAAAKGNTFINFNELTSDQIKYVFDKNKLKQNNLFPGTDILVKSPNEINIIKPDYILILAWNIKDEIIKNIKKINPKCKFIIPFPKIKIYEN